MDTGVYIRKSGESIVLLPGAEVVDDWEGGCRIRSEEKLDSSPGVTLYVVEEDQLVAVRVTGTETETAPFDYAADKDRADIRDLALVAPGGI